MADLTQKTASVGLRGAREIASRKISSVVNVSIPGRDGQRLAIDAASGKIVRSDSQSGGAVLGGKKKT